MSKPELEAHRITKPIQLLAAWLVGLVLIDSAFLTTAAVIGESWLSALLVIASIACVPLFLLVLLFLLKKYRAEMQEDIYYHQYLETKTGSTRIVSRTVQDIRSEMQSSYDRTSKLLEDTQNQLNSLREEVAVLRANPEAHGELTERLGDVERQIQRVQEAVAREEERVDWQLVTIEVNHKLANYRDIVKRLSAARIPIGGTFGSTVPGEFQVSIGRGAQATHIRTLHGLLADLGLESIEYDRDPLYDRRILIGSYAFEHNRYGAKLEGELAEALEDPNTSTGKVLSLIDLLSASSR